MSNLDRIRNEANKKKLEKAAKRHKPIKMSEEDMVHSKVKGPKKIKQTFEDMGDFFVSNILVIRLVDKDGNIINECTRTNENDVTRNKYRTFDGRFIHIIFQNGLLTTLTGVITTEKNLVYVVKESSTEEKKKYVESFNDPNFTMLNTFLNHIHYTNPAA